MRGRLSGEEKWLSDHFPSSGYVTTTTEGFGEDSWISVKGDGLGHGTVLWELGWIAVLRFRAMVDFEYGSHRSL